MLQFWFNHCVAFKLHSALQLGIHIYPIRKMDAYKRLGWQMNLDLPFYSLHTGFYY